MSDWQPIETADRDRDAIWWLDWADDCKPLNPPLKESLTWRRHIGKYGSWSSIYKATAWQPLPPPPDV